jgi:UDP-N-acetylmuramate--alanine ligase
MFAKIQRVHLVGIGGIGMSGIAEVLLTLGYKVSGSDLRTTPVTQRLQALGAVVCEGHRAENVSDAEVVVISSAVTRANPEVAEARGRHIPVIQRAEMLAELMRLKYGIAIAGMHGKTTTTSMVGAVLQAGGLDPTIIVGGRVDALGSNARHGKSHYLVAEADESDRSFLKLSPIISVVTNLDREHLDTYRDMADIEETFADFMDRVPFYGTVVACNDNEPLRELLPNLQRRVVTYGTRADSDFLISDIQCGATSLVPLGTPSATTEIPASCSGAIPGKTAPELPPASRFQVSMRGKSLGEFHLQVPGVHNVLNATAALAVGVGLEIAVDRIREALARFRGVDRRFQVKGTAEGVTVIDDYGHHPTEIKATLAAARQCGFRRIHVIFQPHRYTRTKALLDEFGLAFADADTVAVLDVYPASEPPIPGVTGEAVARKISEAGGRTARRHAGFAEGIDSAVAAANAGDAIVTLGAGSISQLGPQVLDRLRSRAQAVAAEKS